MKAILPHPVLSLGLFVASVMLSDSLAPPSIALALLVAVAAPHIMTPLGVEPVRLGAPLAMLRLTGLVAMDILRSNWAVSQILLGGRRGERVSGFIQVPLDLRARYGLAVLAVIVTSTPGTLWVEYDRTSGRLLIHVLDLVDEAAWVRLIKGRYESLLIEIFE